MDDQEVAINLDYVLLSSITSLKLIIFVLFHYIDYIVAFNLFSFTN